MVVDRSLEVAALIYLKRRIQNECKVERFPSLLKEFRVTKVVQGGPRFKNESRLGIDAIQSGLVVRRQTGGGGEE
jgi:hypothetical protein